MRIHLDSPTRNVIFALAVVLLLSPYCFWVQNHYRAHMDVASPTADGIQNAIQHEPTNADLYDLLGRFHLLVQQEPHISILDFQAALKLNGNASRYWMDMATAEGLSGNVEQQRHALQEAARLDPKTPSVAWEAGNFFLTAGDVESALKSFKVVIENDPVLMRAALDLSWRATHNIDKVLATAVPPDLEVHLNLLEILTIHHETAAAMATWNSLLRLDKPFQAQRAIPFVDYLLQQKDVSDAEDVWKALARNSPSLRPSSNDGNLIVNGSFEQEIIPWGFSWRMDLTAKNSMQVDDSEFHSGSNSLKITFDGKPFADSGLSQFVAVKPGSHYELLVDAKSQEVETANGPRFIVVDGFTNLPLAIGPEWLGTHGWDTASIPFVAGAETRLVRVKLGRVSEFGLIRGHLWIDNVRLYER